MRKRSGDSWNNLHEGLNIFLLPVLCEHEVLCCLMLSMCKKRENLSKTGYVYLENGFQMPAHFLAQIVVSVFL